MVELIHGVTWNRMWVNSQMSGIEDRLKVMGGKLKVQTLNQWYFKVCDRTYMIQLNRKEQIMTISELVDRQWQHRCDHYSFFSFEIWLESLIQSNK
ncbi:hypothetical protein LHV56_19080 [Peribacillus frigoritolerans]|uniref:hypothetical protein n=1 Tax=Peribacillus frigoritolerans TaxID=450367 RepID=UPI00207927A0|nr:hypothetical protein [Peribacillus frigoritolerans]USK78937.1 hypothetical protein LHV56_19080 [Peribacillus frigoritolerans]